jgi:methyl-accepting chemotaxis protein
MGLFKSKAKKEQERRMLVKKSMKELEKRIVKLKEQEAFYINAAREAIKEELPDQIKLAEEALKLTVSERKRTYKMYLNAKIISQMKDMTAMTNEFLGAIHIISKDIAHGTTADISKLSTELRTAMDHVTQQTEGLSEMLEDSQDTLTDFSSGTSLVSDENINQMIYGNSQSTSSDADIDAEMKKLLERLS